MAKNGLEGECVTRLPRQCIQTLLADPLMSHRILKHVAGVLLIAATSLACAASTSADAEALASEKIEASVVKIYATTRLPDLSRPWARQAPADQTGSGVVIDGHRILTNAHVIAYAGQIEVQAEREDGKFLAKVVAVSYTMDLAVLTLDDTGFFDRHPALKRSTALPRVKDAVFAYGYPVGGTSMSITKGIVSRVEFTGYKGDDAGLRVQIDAAINPGNSGGPAVAGEVMIGLAFSTLNGAQNIGFIIPNEEIELFLADIADGRYDGKLMLFDELQTLENPALRAYLHLAPSVHGIVVHRPAVDDANYPLREWDVITSIDGVPVDDEGMILIDQNLRVNLQCQIQRAKSLTDNHVALGIARDGKALTVSVPLARARPSLIRSLDGGYPSYFIYGPLVLSRTTLELASTLGQGRFGSSTLNALSGGLATRLFDRPTPEQQELVVIPAPLFPHPISKGYGNIALSVVSSINGHKISSLAHAVQVLRDLKDEFVVIDFVGRRFGEDLVFRRADIAAATEQILSDNSVRSQGSPDMTAIWEGKPR